MDVEFTETTHHEDIIDREFRKLVRKMEGEES
jgi:hypothetical protein